MKKENSFLLILFLFMAVVLSACSNEQAVFKLLEDEEYEEAITQMDELLVKGKVEDENVFFNKIKEIVEKGVENKIANKQFESAIAQLKLFEDFKHLEDYITEFRNKVHRFKESYEHYNNGLSFYNEGQYEQAFSNWEYVIEQDTENYVEAQKLENQYYLDLVQDMTEDQAWVSLQKIEEGIHILNKISKVIEEQYSQSRVLKEEIILDFLSYYIIYSGESKFSPENTDLSAVFSLLSHEGMQKEEAGKARQAWAEANIKAALDKIKGFDDKSASEVMEADQYLSRALDVLSSEEQQSIKDDINFIQEFISIVRNFAENDLDFKESSDKVHFAYEYNGSHAESPYGRFRFRVKVEDSNSLYYEVVNDDAYDLSINYEVKAIIHDDKRLALPKPDYHSRPELNQFGEKDSSFYHGTDKFVFTTREEHYETFINAVNQQESLLIIEISDEGKVMKYSVELQRGYRFVGFMAELYAMEEEYFNNKE
ncbi:hypothetical protein FZC79_18750 [Rossellomorea vietnamensis]|uniref:Uncharacterized protein n=1 Tax=Rossellomorea vietnamensis TaxID=218284 RepID=A0A5D4K7Z1_9BACI|nr:hypothetical protein [Rossellomorea vietnamensis]TYR73481.1 hypothetical protein FZC79_18750 [Rossellomorea vietnamensis]